MLEKNHNPFDNRRAINEGLEEYQGTVRSKEGMHPEIDVSDFEREREPKPLRKEDIEGDVEGFVGKNFSKLIPFFLEQGTDYSKLIDQLGLTNEDIGNLGADYFIRQINGKKRIFKADQYYPEGIELTEDEAQIKVTDLLALAVLKMTVRIDTLPANARKASSPARRYFYKPRNRYLASNDFGMRVWDENEQRMIDGDPTHVLPMVQTVAQQLQRIAENVLTVPGANVEKVYSLLENQYSVEVRNEVANEVATLSTEEIRQQCIASYGYDPGEYQEWMRDQLINSKTQEILQRVYRPIAEKRAQERVLEVLSNPENQRLVLTGVPVRKVKNQIRYRADQLARDAGLSRGNPIDAYHNFSDRPDQYVSRLIRKPKKMERGEAALDYIIFGRSDKPVLLAEGDDLKSLVGYLEAGLKNSLASKAIEADEGLSPYRCGRGPRSPYYFEDHELIDLVEMVGRTNVEQALERDDRNISEQIQSARYLKHCLGARPMEGEAMKKQLKEAHKLLDSGIWWYLATREKAKIEKEQGELPREIWISDEWLGYVQPRRARQLFAEGKRMYWLAQKCFQQSPGRAQEDRFYRQHNGADWRVYELSGAGIPEEKLNEHLDKNIKLIASFLSLRSFDEGARTAEESIPPVTLETLIKALDTGKDLRGALLASDKRAYFDSVAAGKEPADIPDLLKSWPEEWQKAASKEEVEVAYEYADEYLKSDPMGFTKYVAWRASAEGKEWKEMFADAVGSKGALDFRICLSVQTGEVRNWYKAGAEYVGASTMQDYLLRFNALRDTEGRFGNLHDVLFWVPNITNLEAADAKQVLKSIQTMDDNQEFIRLVQRYRKHDDPFVAREGGIASIRELKKRIIAIEANIDFSSLPPQVVEITLAPGFNASALKDLQREARFRDLVEGKLDKEQTFQPHVRTFAGRDLTEALKEGLGSQKQKIRGTAQDAKGLFHALNQLIKDRKIGDKRMQVVDLFDNVPPDLEEAIIKFLQDQRVDIGPTVKAVVHAKSDPEGWVCGNYTDCCMPFGDYKNTDYMFNKGTQYFTVKYNGRIVAQSVIVDALDGRDHSDVVVLDNIEVAHNYKNLSPLLARVYQTFWTEYTSRPVKVGTGFADLIPPGGRLESNHYRPKHQLGYSDANGSMIYDMPKMRGVESLDKQVTFANLTERDVELIAKMEKEAYPEEGMVMGKSHIAEVLKKQRDLEVPGAASSFLVRQGKEPAGYLLVLPEQSEYTGENVAHIHDLAVLPKFRGTGVAMKIMERAIDIATAYNVSIEAEARASTSYAMLMNTRVREWIKGKGFEVTRSEKLEGYLGGEDFYFVRLENRRGMNEE